MPGPTLNAEAFVLDKRPPSGSFEALTLFAAETGLVTAYHRVAKKPSPKDLHLDLFDRAAFVLEKAPQGENHFVKEVRIVERHAGIGRSYEALRHASRLAKLVARNPPDAEGRDAVVTLLRHAFPAFATSSHPEVTYFKSLYSLIRDEGHPVKQQWAPSLAKSDREHVAALLRLPLAEQTLDAATVGRLTDHLETWAAGNTEFLL